MKLAIGERYGVYSDSAPVGRGAIIGHRYNGLIARTGATSTTEGEGDGAVTTVTPATISGLTIDGTINVIGTRNTTLVGGAVAEATNGIILTDVVSQETINFNTDTDTKKITGHKLGGVVATVSGGNKVTISGGTAKPKFELTGSISSIPVGGAIGNIK